MRLRSRRVGLASTAIVLAILPLLLPNAFWYDLATRAAINAVVVIGLNLLIGYAGQLSLGHAGFIGIGAYASAVLTSRLGWPPLAAMGKRKYIAGVLPMSHDNLVRWLREPQSVVPHTAMPDTGLTEGDAHDIAAYLGGLK